MSGAPSLPSCLRAVFVVGCPRSGSTMLGAMLGGHSDVVCIPEAQFLVKLMPEAGRDAPVDPAGLIDRISHHWRFRVWEFDLGQSRPTLGEIAPTFRATVEWLVGRYGESIGRQAAQIWVDQGPGNVLHIWKLLEHFPDAKFIHLIRDGRAVAASIMPLDWGPNEIYSATRFWKHLLAYGYVAGAALGPERMLHVRYEDLVTDTERTMRRVATFVGIEFAPSMLSTTGLKLPSFTRYMHQLIGAPPQSEGANKWRRTLSRRQIEIFESEAGDLLPLLGYEQVFGKTQRLSALEKGACILRNEIKKTVNAVRFWLRTRPYRL